MSANLDMSLDEIIRNNQRSRGHNSSFKGGGRGRGRASGPGPDRRVPNRNPIRPKPYPIQPPMQAPVTMWQPQMVPTGVLNSEDGTKLYISNLDYGVSNEDIKVLFSDIGDLKRYSIHYDMSGRSKGTAEVVFTRHADAVAAIKRYNNVQLDGKPMKIELVGVNLVAPALVPPTNNSILGRPNLAFMGGQERVGGRGPFFVGGVGSRGRGSTRGRGFARGRGQRGHVSEKLSAEDLDAELEKYHLDAMHIN